MTSLRAGLEDLAEALERAEFRLPRPDRRHQDGERRDVVRTIREYLLPRLRDPDAPVVAALIGAGGVGKSVVLNSLAAERISPVGAVRPTTRSAVLWAHGDHSGRYWSDFVARIRERVGATVEVVIGSDELTRNLTIVDTPPIDFVAADGAVAVEEVASMADLGVFVASVLRYADAAAWSFLHRLHERGLPLLFVLNRLPGEARQRDELLDHYARRLHGDGLLLDADRSLVFAVEEGVVGPNEALPAGSVALLRKELGELSDPDFRQALVKQTAEGAIRSVVRRAGGLSTSIERDLESARRLADSAQAAYEAQADELTEAIDTGEFAWLVDHDHWPSVAVDLTGVVTRRAGIAAQTAAGTWELDPIGRRLIEQGGQGLWRHGHDTTYDTQRLLEEWAASLGSRAIQSSKRGRLRKRAQQRAADAAWKRVLDPAAEPPRSVARRFGERFDGLVAEARRSMAETLRSALSGDGERFGALVDTDRDSSGAGVVAATERVRSALDSGSEGGFATTLTVSSTGTSSGESDPGGGSGTVVERFWPQPPYPEGAGAADDEGEGHA